MKSDNDSIDKALRDALRRKLGNLEFPPGSSVNERTREAIKVFTKRASHTRWITGVSVVVLAILAWMFPAIGVEKDRFFEPVLSRKSSKNTNSNGMKDTQRLPGGTRKTPHRPTTAAATGPFAPNKNPRSVSARLSGTNAPETAGVKAPTTGRKHVEASFQKESIPSFLSNSTYTTPNFSNSTLDGSEATPDLSTLRPSSFKALPGTIALLIPGGLRIMTSLKPVSSRVLENAPDSSGISHTKGNSEADPETLPKNQSKTAVIFALTGINTIQKLIVMPHQQARFQNFHLPLSVHNLGLNAEAGLEKAGFQLAVTFSHFDQDLSYEVATDEYIVEENTEGHYEQKRKGVSMTEHVRFSLLGLSLKKQLYFNSPALRTYYGQLGVSFNHDLFSSSNSGWIHIGAGKNMRLSGRALLTLGPYAGYSLGRLSSTNTAFRFRPLHVGISAGLKLFRN